jgi:hypothetical protein
MEQPIVVLVDPEERVVHLYGKYNRDIAFDDAYLLPVFLKGNQIIYISQADSVETEDIVNLVTSLRESSGYSGRYIHGKIEGWVNAPDIRFTLAGLRDSKPIDKLGYDIFEKSAALRELLLSDKIEIISEEHAQSIKKKLPHLITKDKSLDEIIIKTSVSSVIEQDSFFDDVDEITSDQPDVVTEAEMNIRKGIGIERDV